MNKGIALHIECMQSSLMAPSEIKEDMLLLHLEECVNANNVFEFVRGLTFADNLSFIMTSGFMSEAIHDVIDEIIEEDYDKYGALLTSWSEEKLDDSLWEFINAHGDKGVRSARVIVITATPVLQGRILHELGYRDA